MNENELLNRLQVLPVSAREALADLLTSLNIAEKLNPNQIPQQASALLHQLRQMGLKDLLPRRRVVITGMGAISPVGLNLNDTWNNLLRGVSGVDYVTQIDPTPFPTKIAAEVKGFDPLKYVPRKIARRMARVSQFAIAATQEALEDAGIPWPLRESERSGVIFGIALGGFNLYQDAIWQSSQRGTMRVRPMVATGGLPNMPTFHVNEHFGIRGLSETVVTACASGTQAIGQALETIRSGIMDTVITGGMEALICEFFFSGFTAMKAISTRNDPPQKASSPFDAKRDGFIIGEGAGVLVMESLEHALARGAKIYAEILGAAATSDAYHVAAPDPAGRGAQACIQRALDDAGVSTEDVDYINSHGTSTPLNDKVETLAIKKVFGEHAYDLVVNSTKSMIGHTFGGAGGLEAIVTAKSVETGLVHPTINYEDPDPECDLDYVPNSKRRLSNGIRIAISNSFGLGGQNATIVLGPYIP